MKKLYFLMLTVVVSFSVFAQTTHLITASPAFTFLPDDITITEGDDVQFMVGASHPVLEVDQATWNANGLTGNGGFSILSGNGTETFNTAGTFYYICTNHIASGMKGKITVQAAPPSGSSDLLISGAYDGPLSGGTPKGIELFVLNNIPDLSIYGIGSANNGGGTDGEEFTFPAVSATAGDYIYVATEAPNFTTFFGFAPDYTDGSMGINGDDAVELFMNGSVVDVFGDINVDGTGTPWEYLDGWAYRVDGTGPDGSTFVLANWTFSGANAYDGESDNATAATPLAIGTYQATASPSVDMDVAMFTMNEADGATAVANLLIDPMVTMASSVEVHLVGGTGDATDFSGITFPSTVSVATTDNMIPLSFTPNNDVMYEGDETFEFVLRNPTGDLTLGADSMFTLTMTDDELPPDTTIFANPDSITVNEADGTADLTFEISQLSTGTTFTADVVLMTGDAADIDGYTTQSVSFDPSGVTSQVVTVSITDDALVEGNENLVFRLMNLSSGLTLGGDSLFVLTIEDNDLPEYDIADVVGVDAGGNSDSMGVECILEGIVNSPDRGFNALEFSFQDATGGIGFYSNQAPFSTMEVAVGDEIRVIGTIGQFRGVTQVVNISELTILSSGNLLTELVVTEVLEEDESELIRMDGLTIPDPSQWTPDFSVDPAGFTVEAMDGNSNIVKVRIDRDYVDLVESSAPCGTIDIIGVATQIDPDSAFVDEYMILPRTLDDIIGEPCSAVTIADVVGVDAGGNPTSFGQVVTVQGIVNSPDRGFNALEFSFQDATGGIGFYSNIAPFSTMEVAVGDEVRVTGEIGQFRGVTQLINISELTFLSSENSITESIVTEVIEEDESELIRINGLELVAASQWVADEGNDPTGFTVEAMDENSNIVKIRIDRDYVDLYTSSAPDNSFDIIGVATQNDPDSAYVDEYMIMPRSLDDIIEAVGIDEIELENLSIYPNPATEVVNVSFEAENTETVTISVFNTLGALVFTTVQDLNIGMNNVEVDVANLTTSIYFVEIQLAAGKTTQLVAVK